MEIAGKRGEFVKALELNPFGSVSHYRHAFFLPRKPAGADKACRRHTVPVAGITVYLFSNKELLLLPEKCR